MPRPQQKLPVRRWLLLLSPVLVLAILYSVFAGPRGLLKVQDLREQKRAMEREIDSLERVRETLLDEKRRLLTDMAYIERLARKELGMAKPGEQVYRFVDPDAVDTVPAAGTARTR